MTINSGLTIDIELRLSEIEKSLVSIWQMLRTAMNREQFNRLNIIRQNEMVSLNERLNSTEASLLDLEQKYNNLL